MIREQPVLGQYLSSVLHRYRSRLNTCSTKSALDEEDIRDLGELVGGVPRRLRTHVAVPKVPRGFPELVNVRGEYHRHVAAERKG